jgi:hypothetical protein
VANFVPRETVAAYLADLFHVKQWCKLDRANGMVDGSPVHVVFQLFHVKQLKLAI